MSNLPPSGEWLTWRLSMTQRLKNWQNKPLFAESQREGSDAWRTRPLRKVGYLISILELGRCALEDGLLVSGCVDNEGGVMLSHLLANVHRVCVLQLPSMHVTLCGSASEG